MILQFFIPLFLTTAVTLLVTPLCIRTAVHFGLIDQPNSAPHKIHDSPVPKAGGIAIVTAIFLVMIGGGMLPADDEVRPILIASIPIFVFGMVDDARGLSAIWKLLGQGIAVGILIWQGVYVRMLP